MDLRSLSDAELLVSTENAAREEREALTKVLHHLREVDRRRLYSSVQCKSLHEYAVEKLKYTSDRAYRRIAAMKLLRELPEIEEKINQGELSLTHLNYAQTLFKKEEKVQRAPISLERKLAVIDQFAGTSTREAEVLMFSLSSEPETLKPDRVRAVSVQHIELKFTATAELQEKITRVKGLLAHKNPDISMGELFDKLCELGLKEWDPARKIATPRKPRANKCVSKKQNARMQKQANQNPETQWSEAEKPETKAHEAQILKSQLSKAQNAKTPSSEVEASRAEFTAPQMSKAAIRREVFRRANSQCENCGSGFGLEIDHVRRAPCKVHVTPTAN